MRSFYTSALVFSALLLTTGSVFAQNVGIANTNITPDAEAILELRSTTKGVLLPRMNTAQTVTLGASLNATDDGMTVYDTSTKQYKYWNGTTLTWNVLATSSTVTGSTLDDAYDAGGAGLGRSITADAGAIQVNGTGGTIAIETDGDIQLTTDDAWIGSSPTLQRLRFDDNSSGRIHVEAADLTMDSDRWIGIDGSNPRIEFEGGSGRVNVQDADIKVDDDAWIGLNASNPRIEFDNTNDRLDMRAADIEVDAGKWIGIGSTVERVIFDGTDNQINIMGATGGVGINTEDPDAELDIIGEPGGSPFLIKAVKNSNVASELSGIGLGSEDLSHIVKSGIVHERESPNGTGKLHFLVDDNVDANDVALTESRMTIDRNGLVGIGTTSPSEELHVVGDGRITNLGGGGNSVVTTDNNGLLGRTSLTGNGNDVYTGAGTFVDAGSLSTINNNDFIQNQNSIDQGASFRINGWGETYGIKINAPDGEKLQFTSLGANGSKIRHTTGWALDYHAGPGNSTTTGSHRFYTTAQNVYRERLGIESTGRVNVRQDIGSDPAFTGLESPETASGRAQVVLSSSYSDLVVASSENNGNGHGSTISMVTYNPANQNDYRKWVINQGNWTARENFLDFGYGSNITNPHSAINTGNTSLSLDGTNRRVGIAQSNPTARLHVRGVGNNNPDQNGVYVYNEDTGGDNDDAIVTTRVNGGSAGDPFFSMDVGGVTGWSVGLDNSDADKLKFANSWSDPGTNTRMTIQTNGYVGIGTAAPGQILDVNGNIHLGSSTGNKQIYTWTATDANWRMGMSASPGFNRAMSTAHVQYMTYAPGATQGFAVGVNGGNSSFETRGSDHQAYFRGDVGIQAADAQVKLAVGGNGVNQYSTDLWVENNEHVQGNETLNQGGRGRLRVGTAWGFVGLYADASSTSAANDLVLGAGSGLVRVGPNGGGQNLRVSGLEGTGDRPVYADANGILVTGNRLNYSVASNLAYSFDDAGGWTNAVSCDDCISGAVNIGFTMSVFGTNYTQLQLSSNGYITFGGSGGPSTLGNGCLPTGTFSMASLMFWWDDLIANSFRYRTVGTAPNRVWQARYDGYQFNNGGEIVDCMITMHEGSNLIVVRYDDVGCCGDDAKGGGATFGLQGPGGASAKAIPVGCNSPLTDDNQGANASQFMSFRAPY